ncbi:hypothetical protein LTR53_006610 [Teratosphaeriaceae sp. CCFEE 6253]|nr:hypothetical protein LTR53_006610 [Teratosphaeriaceae sp. CCFEE 6253]
MGSSASKASRAAGSAARNYPTRAPPTSQTTSAPPPPSAAFQQSAGPTVHPQARASGTRDEAINLDASDPDFARSLRSLGPVQPNPTLSTSSAFPNPSNPNNPSPTRTSLPPGPDPRKNPAITVLDSRARLQDQADLEFQQAGRRGHAGRQFLDVYMIRDILTRRDVKGKTAVEIEKAMGLKAGVVERLGARGVVGLAQEVGRAEKGINMVGF